MGFILRAAIAIAISSILVAGSVGVVDRSSVLAVDEIPGAQLEKARIFRERFGFDSSVSIIQRAAAALGYSDELYGVPLSKNEEAEMQRRIGLERAAQAGVDFGMEQPEWAGWYIDQQDRGAPVFMFTGDSDSKEIQLASLLSADTRFRVVDAQRTWIELLETQKRIDNARERLAAEGIHVTMTGIAVGTNKVDVGVDGLTEAAVKALSSEFGDGLSFRDEPLAEADACSGASGTTDCRPMKGGLRIYIGADPTRQCSSGFIVRRSSNGGQLSVLTAGHCIAGPYPVNTPWYHNGSQFGLSKFHTWANNSGADVGIIEIDANSTDRPTSANRLWIFNGTTGGQYTVTYQTPDVYQTAGVQACAYGSLSNDSECGTVGPNVNVSHTSPAWGVTNTITGTYEYSINLIPGDSGGPIYQVLSGTARAALGTHVHSTSGGIGDPGYGWYSTIARGQLVYDQVTTDSYTLCVTAAC